MHKRRFPVEPLATGGLGFREEVHGGMGDGTATIVADATHARKRGTGNVVLLEPGDLLVDLTRCGEKLTISVWRVEGFSDLPFRAADAYLVELQRHNNYVPARFEGIIREGVLLTQTPLSA